MNSLKIASVISRSFSRSCGLQAKDKFSDINLNLTENAVKVPVETDTERLANYVCGTNLFISGGEDVKLKADSEYPDWLWKFRSPPPLEELDPNTKTYWNRIRNMRLREQKYLLKFQKYKTLQK